VGPEYLTTPFARRKTSSVISNTSKLNKRAGASMHADGARRGAAQAEKEWADARETHAPRLVDDADYQHALGRDAP
jgi:hypothetical protein